jgi:hypothetical protein
MKLWCALSEKTSCAWNNEDAEHVELYLTLLGLMNDDEEIDQVEALLAWWDR